MPPLASRWVWRPRDVGRLPLPQIHSRGIPLAADVDLAAIAASTPRYTGAELAAVCREAAMAALQEDIHGGAQRLAGQARCPEHAGSALHTPMPTPAAALPRCPLSAASEVHHRHFAAALAGIRAQLTDSDLARYADFGS